VDALIPYARNARTHSDEQVAQIAASIKEWGWTTPVLIDEDGGIIAGHGRVMAARKLGIEEVPTMTATGWTKAQKQAYVLADNQLPQNAGWDMDLLSVEMKDLDTEGFDLSLIGFGDDMLRANMLVDETEGLTDEDAVPDVPENPVTVLGDVWLLGNHRLMCGDSTSIDAVEKLMGGQKADMVFTDPPYGVDLKGADLAPP
jgi:ParB-like chromosome segregation protein Spo0J